MWAGDELRHARRDATASPPSEIRVVAGFIRAAAARPGRTRLRSPTSGGARAAAAGFVDLVLPGGGVQPDHLEVHHPLQSQQGAWPNDVAAQVLAEGVGSIVENDRLGWFLYFAALDPSDAPADPATGKYDTSVSTHGVT